MEILHTLSMQASKQIMNKEYVPGIIKVIIEKSRGSRGRFLWNRNWDLGWIWAGSATFEIYFLKKIVDGENIFGIE